MVEWHHRLDGYELEQAPGKSGVHGVAKSQFLTSGGQSIGVSASASVLPMNVQD